MDVRRNPRQSGEHPQTGSLPFFRRPRAPEPLTAGDTPELNHPVMVCAFEGWNDAGEAASYAALHLARTWRARPFAEIDPDEFYDFTQVRPEAVVHDSGRRRIVWPSTSLAIARGGEGEHDIVLVRGPEPQLRWSAYCSAIVELATLLKVERVVTFGAYLAEVTHSRPVPVNASSADPGLTAEYHLQPSMYEGPTGIVGVIGTAFQDAGIPVVSVWASVPCYSLPTSPKAALALLRGATGFIGRRLPLEALEGEALAYEHKMDELVEEDENVAEYVERIAEMEEVVGAELSVEGLTDEIERFLRDDRRN